MTHSKYTNYYKIISAYYLVKVDDHQVFISPPGTIYIYFYNKLTKLRVAVMVNGRMYRHIKKSERLDTHNENVHAWWYALSYHERIDILTS